MADTGVSAVLFLFRKVMGHGGALVWPGLNEDASALSCLTATSAEVAAETGL